MSVILRNFAQFVLFSETVLNLKILQNTSMQLRIDCNLLVPKVSARTYAGL